MSVTTSSQTHDLPPLLFGQRASPFTSPPLSPTQTQHIPTMTSHQDEDIDMSTSTILQRPDGQNHDRQGTVETLHPPQITQGNDTESSSSESESDDSQEALEAEDAMDTTPDRTQVQANPVSIPAEPTINGAILPPPEFISLAPPGEQTIRLPPISDLVPPPPPPPPAEETPPQEDSDDMDDGAWRPIPEDVSSPDAEELEAIEAGPEHSALDRVHWELKSFPELGSDPEHVAGASGRIDWEIKYNGTKDDPNQEVLMRSPVVSIGGYDWQMKFYPKGNDTEYLSVYLECLTVMKRNQPESASVRSVSTDDVASSAPDAYQAGREESEPQFTPLTLLDDAKDVPSKRPSVAVQFAVVMYNPAEPRVYSYRTNSHRFCPNSSDWGWTRFYGPHYEIHQRQRHQRQAMLRNDTLAFTAYVRIVEDATGCLYEHHNQRDNQWDSFAMTGLQGLALPEHAPGGNLISAVSLWLLLRPFREFLTSFRVPDFISQPRERPKPLLSALQKVLYLMRTQVKRGSGPIGLEDVTDALAWYGVYRQIEKLDVIETWNILRAKIEDEIQGSAASSAMTDLFGLRQDGSSQVPNYRIPVKGCRSIQEGIEKADSLLLPSQKPPPVLTLELERQAFDEPSRTWKKINHKVRLDESVNVRGFYYTLYGLVVHKENLQSGLYESVVRPSGPAGKWYSYHDGRDENRVICLPRRRALDDHEGTDSLGTGNYHVAYITMYVRNDVANAAFAFAPTSYNVSGHLEPQKNAHSDRGTLDAWNVPGWIKDEIEKQTAAEMMPTMDDVEVSVHKAGPVSTSSDKPRQFDIITSDAFASRSGGGIIDTYDPRWTPGSSEFVHTIDLQPSDDTAAVQSAIAKVFPKVKESRQIRFWFLDSQRGSEGRPLLISPSSQLFPCNFLKRDGSWRVKDLDSYTNYFENRIWVHVIDEKDLPKRPEAVQAPSSHIPAPASGLDEGAANAQAARADAPPPTAGTLAPSHTIDEDAVMSDPEDEVYVPRSAPSAVVGDGTEGMDPLPPPPVTTSDHGADRPDLDPYARPPAVLGDTDMLDGSIVLPPIAALSAEAVNTTANTVLNEPSKPAIDRDEFYFFLKVFDPDTQTLTSKGFHLANKNDRLDETIQKIHTSPSSKTLHFCEEDDEFKHKQLRRHRSFASNDLMSPAIILAFPHLEEDAKLALRARGEFAHPANFLYAEAHMRNFPRPTSGVCTENAFSHTSYIGEMKYDHRHGQGTYICFNNDVYSGTFALGLRHGTGTIVHANGDTYEGSWYNDLMHGHGKFTHASSGNVYEGNWQKGKKFGEGVTKWKAAEESEKLCRVCWDEAADAAFYDCGHVVACLACARQVEVCPVCRKRVLSCMKLYYVAG